MAHKFHNIDLYILCELNMIIIRRQIVLIQLINEYYIGKTTTKVESCWKGKKWYQLNLLIRFFLLYNQTFDHPQQHFWNEALVVYEWLHLLTNRSYAAFSWFRRIWFNISAATDFPPPGWTFAIPRKHQRCWFAMSAVNPLRMNRFPTMVMHLLYWNQTG